MRACEKEECYGAKVEKRFGERLRKKLIEENLLNFEHLVLKNSEHIIFPLKRKPSKEEFEELAKIGAEIELGRFKFEIAKKKPRSLKEALQGLLGEEEIEKLVTSFDVIGDIAIIEIPDELLSKKELIGKALLEAHPHVKTAARVLSKHIGKFRLRPIEIIAGERKTLTIHKESGCVFKVDVAKTYFSPRLSFERMRIARQIRKDEIIGAWFAGVGPFPIIFAKHSQMKKAIAIELNPRAYKLLEENIKLNKCEGKVQAILGDVKEAVPKLGIRFDRIVMPLPKGSELFLDEAFQAIEPRGIVHFYQFAPRDEPFKQVVANIKEVAEKHGREVKIVEKRIVRSVAATKVQVVIDFKVE
jgi:tRNA (guanine37-N1)-methyltransferase